MSNNFGLSQIAATQSNKHVTANDQVGQLDAALTGILSVEVDDTDAASITTEQFQPAGAPTPSACSGRKSMPDS